MSILDTVPDCIFCYLAGRIYNRYEAIQWLSKLKENADENPVDVNQENKDRNPDRRDFDIAPTFDIYRIPENEGSNYINSIKNFRYRKFLIELI